MIDLFRNKLVLSYIIIETLDLIGTNKPRNEGTLSLLQNWQEIKGGKCKYIIKNVNELKSFADNDCVRSFCLIFRLYSCIYRVRKMPIFADYQ